MTPRRLFTGLALLAALVVPSAIGAPAVLSAEATITGPASDGYFTLEVKNTGDETIRCFRLAVPTSVKVVSARSIRDWRVFASTARCFAAFGPSVPGEEELARRMRNLELAPRGMELLRQLDVVEQLSRIDCPTLVCVGGLDPVTPVEASREIA